MTVSQQTLDELWDFSDAAASERRLRDAAEAASGTDRAELETQVARALGLQERYDEADAVLDAVDGESTAVRVRLALERGRVRNSSGDPDAAASLFRSAEADAASAGLVFLRVDALHMLGIADPAGAEAWTAQALDVLSGVTDPRTLRWTVALHNNAGWTHFDAGRYDEALVEFEAAKDSASRWGTSQQVQWADEALTECRAALAGEPSPPVAE